jgi:hypothetical protein
MSRLIARAVMASLLPVPLLAGPPATKRPQCQLPKAPARDGRRTEPCRKPVIPPVIDQTPLFLASTAPGQVVLSDLS